MTISIGRPFFYDQTIIQMIHAITTTPSISVSSRTTQNIPIHNPITRVFFKSLTTSAPAVNINPPKNYSVLKKGIIMDQSSENTQWVNWVHLMVGCIFRYKNENLNNNLGIVY